MRTILILLALASLLPAQFQCNSPAASIQAWLNPGNFPPVWSTVTCGGRTPVVKLNYSDYDNIQVTGPINSYCQVWASNPAPVPASPLCFTYWNLVNDRSYVMVGSGFLHGCCGSTQGQLAVYVYSNIDSGECWTYQAWVSTPGSPCWGISAAIYLQNG